MLRSARWHDDATQAVWLQRSRDLTHRLPEKFCVLEGLASDDDIRAFGSDFLPVVWIAQDDIDIVPRSEIDADVFPGREGEERAVGSVDVLAAQIENDERFVSTRFEIIAPEGGHLVEGAWVHRQPVNLACPWFATALSKSALHSWPELQS